MHYGKLVGIHENIFAANFDSITIHSHRGVLANLAGGHVLVPPMPGTRYDFPVHDSLAQRPNPMQTGIVDGIELAAHIGHGNRFALHLELSNRSRRDFIRLRCSRKRHLVFTLLRRRMYLANIQISAGSAASTRHEALFLTPFTSLISFASYFGSGVCATITPFLNSSTICAFRRTSVVRFASVI